MGRDEKPVPGFDFPKIVQVFVDMDRAAFEPPSAQGDGTLGIVDRLHLHRHRLRMGLQHFGGEPAIAGSRRGGKKDGRGGYRQRY